MSNTVPVYHPPKPKRPRKHTGSSTSTSSSSSSSSSGGSSGGGGGGGSSASSSSNAYLASQKKAQKKAARRYIEQAESMRGQIAALKNSLSVGFKAALTQRLANISLVQGQQDATLVEGYKNRVKTLEDSAKDNDAAAADTGFQNLGNRARERANAVTEAVAQGAGESDVLKAGLMSLRNWDANQGEVNRSYFDTLRSVNSSLTDLNADTKTSRINMASQANADRDQVYSQYYDQRSETYTQLGNLYGQQGELFGLANEQVGNKKTQHRRRKAVHDSAADFMAASRANSQAYKNPGVGAELMNWEGHEPIEGDLNNNKIAAAPTNEVRKRPEGATLRSWTV